MLCLGERASWKISTKLGGMKVVEIYGYVTTYLGIQGPRI